MGLSLVDIILWRYPKRLRGAFMDHSNLVHNDYPDLLNLVVTLSVAKLKCNEINTVGSSQRIQIKLLFKFQAYTI